MVVGAARAYRQLGPEVVDDDWPGAGPLGCIATALRSSRAHPNLVVACDLLYLRKPWLDFLVGRSRKSDADAVLPVNFKGMEPLWAMYHKRCEAARRSALEKGTRKVTEGLAELRIERIEPTAWQVFDPDGWLLKNMNSLRITSKRSGDSASR